MLDGDLNCVIESYEVAYDLGMQYFGQLFEQISIFIDEPLVAIVLAIKYIIII